MLTRSTAPLTNLAHSRKGVGRGSSKLLSYPRLKTLPIVVGGMPDRCREDCLDRLHGATNAQLAASYPSWRGAAEPAHVERRH